MLADVPPRSSCSWEYAKSAVGVHKNSSGATGIFIHISNVYPHVWLQAPALETTAEYTCCYKMNTFTWWPRHAE